MAKISILPKVLVLGVLLFTLTQIGCSRGVIDSSSVGTTEDMGGSSSYGGSGHSSNYQSFRTSPYQPASTYSNNIYRSYELAFNEELGYSVLTAVFSVSGEYGTYVRLTPPSQFVVNGQLATENSVRDGSPESKVAAFYAGFISPIFWLFLIDRSSTTYRATLPRSERVAELAWTDQTGRIISDTLRVTSPNILLPTVLRRGQDLAVRSLHGIHDSIYLRVEAQGSGAYENGGSSISSASLDTLPRGPARISVEVRNRQSLDLKGSAGGHATVVYRQTPQQILLVD